MRSLTPHLSDEEFSSLDQLAMRMLRRFGETHAGTVDGETVMMMIELANDVIDEVSAHPYWDKSKPLPYYTHYSERRPVPDNVMLNGLMAFYAEQQFSEKAEMYRAKFFHVMNRTLAERAGYLEQQTLKRIER